MIKKHINWNNEAERQAFFEEAVQILGSIFEMKYATAIEDVAEDMDADDRVVLILYPEDPMLVTSFEHRNDSFPDYDFDTIMLEDEFRLCVIYDSSCVVVLGDNEFLVEAPLLITNMDEDGNEINVGINEAFRALDFLKDRETIIEVDGEAFPAFRLTF